MGKRQDRGKAVSKSPKRIVVPVVVAVAVVAVGLAVAFGLMQAGTPPSDNGSGASRTVPWIHVHGLGLDPADPSVLYIATHGDFYRSVNAGLPVKVDKQRADYMAFNSPQAVGAPLYASGHPSTGGNTGLIRSTDGGQTWERVSNVAEPPVDFHAMSVAKSDPKVILGFDIGRRGLFKTTDAGQSWQNLDSPGGFVTALAISPADVNTIMAGTDAGLYQSNDGGVTWKQLNQYKGIAVMALAFDSDVVLYASTEQFGLARSSDAGNTWAPIERPPNGLTTTSIVVDSASGAIYVAGYASPQGYQEVYKASTDGMNWQLVGTNKQ